MNRERGSVTVIVAALVLVVLVLSLGVADLGRVLVARSHARTAADASALAVAQELVLPSGRDPIDVAAEFAARNGAVMRSCLCVSGTFEATVTVEIAVEDLLLIPGSHTVTAAARAVVDLPSPASTPSPPGAQARSDRSD